MTDLVFHIGLTKTASTFLQKNMFYGKMYTLENVGQKIIDERVAAEFQDKFCSTSPHYWRTSDAIKFFSRYNNSVNNVLISHESIYEHVPFVKEGCYNKSMLEPYLFVNRIREIKNNCWPHGNVKVLFFFRRQYDWLASIYSHVCYRLDNPSQKNFENSVVKLLGQEYGALNAIRYDILYKYLCESLGAENVFVYPYEDIMSAELWKKIRLFTGINKLGVDVDWNDKVNAKKNMEKDWYMSKKTQLYSKLPYNEYIKFILNYVLGYNSVKKIKNLYKDKYAKKIVLPDYLTNEIISYFYESNKKIEYSIGVSLAKYGYFKRND